MNGRALEYFLNGGATTTVIPDLSSTLVSAFSEDSSAFSYSGAGNTDGGFSIPNPPSTSLFVSLGSSGAYTATDGGPGPIDLSGYYLGRSDGVYPETGTVLTLTGTHMAAWHNGDDVEFVSPGVGLQYADLINYGYATISAGATSFDAGVDYAGLISYTAPYPSGGLIDSAEGDSLYVTHLVNQSVSGSVSSASSVKESYVVSNLTMTQGGTLNRASGQFSDAGTAGTISATYPAGAFATLRSAINGSVEVASDQLLVDALVQGTTTGGFLGGPDLLIANLKSSNVDIPVSYSWVNPYPSSWPLILSATESVAVNYTQMGGSATQYAYSSLTSQAVYDGAHAPSLAPGISAVVSPQINQKSLTSTQTHTGLTPIISWSAPHTGTPTYYQVSLVALFAAPTSYQVASFTLPATQTSMQIPQGVLENNGEYVAVISAISEPGFNPATPLLSSLPMTSVPLVSAAFAPVAGTVIGGTGDGGTGWPIVPDQGDAPAIASPNLVVITFNGDGNQSVIDGFATWIATQGYLPAVASQYGVGNGTVQSIHIDPNAYPLPTGTSTNANAFPDYLQSLFDAGVLPAFASNNIYSLLIPLSWADTDVFCTTAGGYHTTYSDDEGNPVVYAVVPNCEGQYTVAEQQAQIEIAYSHEIIEASTDPLIGVGAGTYQIQNMTTPWFYLGGEVGDLCASNDTVYSGSGYSAQLIWSNTAVAAGQVPCQPWNAATPYYSLLGPATMVTGQAGKSVKITVTGWSSMANDTALIGLYAQDGDYYVDFPSTPTLSAETVQPGHTVTVTLTIPASAQSGQHGAAWVLAQDPTNGNYDGSTMVGVTVE